MSEIFMCFSAASAVELRRMIEAWIVMQPPSTQAEREAAGLVEAPSEPKQKKDAEIPEKNWTRNTAAVAPAPATARTPSPSQPTIPPIPFSRAIPRARQRRSPRSAREPPVRRACLRLRLRLQLRLQIQLRLQLQLQIQLRRISRRSTRSRRSSLPLCGWRRKGRVRKRSSISCPGSKTRPASLS